MVSLGPTNTELRVGVGVGVLMVLPDGSLWRWGLPGGRSATLTNAALPEQIGTNHDWIDAVAANNHCVALKRDGTIWEWGWLAGSASGNRIVKSPEQVGTDHDWAAVSGGDTHAVALKRDGTLWTWGDGTRTPLGTGVFTKYSEPVQIGTNTDWVGHKTLGSTTYAIRRDGSLWQWGGFGVGTITTPTQVCREVDWAALCPGNNFWAFTRSGEIWDLFSVAPSPTTTRQTAGRLMATNAAPSRVAWTPFALVELRPDGTLWTKPDARGSFPSAFTIGKVQRLGHRSDWVAVWGWGTAMGLTSDGIIWSWGSDLGHEPIPDFPSRITLAKVQIMRLLGQPVKSYQTSASYPVAKEPRPLMRMLPTPVSAPTAHEGTH